MTLSKTVDFSVIWTVDELCVICEVFEWKVYMAIIIIIIDINMFTHGALIMLKHNCKI
jgi:hypothetical protein